jgi:amino acid transporter
MSVPTDSSHSSQLVRRLGLLQATALNMSNMIGVGPFITIPLLMTGLGGPQALIGWLVALVIVAADGLVWSELGAALPGSGGSYQYLRTAYGPATWGRLMAFLFIWQFILSGPLEIASGYIGFSNYVRYVWRDMSSTTAIGVAVVAGVMNIALLYRRIESIGALTVTLWIGTILTTAVVILSGAFHFNPGRAFDFPPGAFTMSMGMLLGLGASARIGIYDYLGYYDVCYVGDEVKEPQRVIPRAILISVFFVALIYAGINLSVIGVVPWREFVPASSHAEADYIVSIFMERIYGSRIASLFTILVLWTGFASVFALLLGYSRIPYAAALDGTFFRAFGRVHATKRFPHVSLLVIGIISIVCATIPLGTVIDALLTTRILVQFIGQIGAVWLLRRAKPEVALPFKMWLYPLPTLVALAGWIFLFSTSGLQVMALGTATLVAGVLVFLGWTKATNQWPWEGVRSS